MPADRIVIANCGGFWGDDPTAARRQVEGGPVDYLVMDYLAEVTMAILQKQMARKPEAGYATDFVAQMRDVLPACVERGIKVISNAGGVNPLSCKAAVEKLADELGIGDRVRVGVVLGDDIECRPQCTGGNFTDWQKVKSHSNLGFPLVEATPDGPFTVTKHPGTGGLVSVHSVSEQLLYEMGAPQYLAPDCIARFDSIRLTQDGPDRVGVSGIVGEPPPEKLKVSVSFAHGYRAFGRLIVSGPDTLAKAEKVAQLFWESAGGPELYEDASTQFVAWSATHPSLTDSEPSEIVVQVAVRDSDERKI